MGGITGGAIGGIMGGINGGVTASRITGRDLPACAFLTPGRPRRYRPDTSFSYTTN
jgi:hypothetical protein